jgi:hypothetical protein
VPGWINLFWARGARARAVAPCGAQGRSVSAANKLTKPAWLAIPIVGGVPVVVLLSAESAILVSVVAAVVYLPMRAVEFPACW